MKNPGLRSLALGLCLCLLYVGYELARACTISLFTTRAAGLNGVAVAIAGFLLSIASLALYGHGVEAVGASWTLFVSTSVCCCVFVLGAVGLFIVGEETVHDGADGADQRLRAALLINLFAFREAYVTVVGTQIWTLLSTDLKGKGKDVSRWWFCIIQGVSCICSALAGLAAGRMATAGGQVYLLLATAISLLAIVMTVGFTCCFTGSGGSSPSTWDVRNRETNGRTTEQPPQGMTGKGNTRTGSDPTGIGNTATCSIANDYGANGAMHNGGRRRGKADCMNGDSLEKSTGVNGLCNDAYVDTTYPRPEGVGLWRVLMSSASLFSRNPLLAALLAEAVVCQVLTATLNMSFNEAVRHSRTVGTSLSPTARGAGFVGVSFAVIGLVSGALQLVVMPWAMARVGPSLLLRALPIAAGAGYAVSFLFPGFRMATVAFAITKILDYSVRGIALELVYQPMPDRERLLGKEAIATVGVRIGRTLAHVALYLCSAALGGAPSQRVLMAISLLAASLWALTLSRVALLSPNASVYGMADVTKGPRESDAVVADREMSSGWLGKGLRERSKGREKLSGSRIGGWGGGGGGGGSSRVDNGESEFINFSNGSGVVLPPGVDTNLKKES